MAVPLSLRVVEAEVRTYRRTWRGSVFTSFLNPILYLLAMGVGLGSLVDANLPAGIEGVTYLAFLAPGLLVATAMQTGAGEGSWKVMAAIEWTQTWKARLATPIGIPSLVLGHIVWGALRVLMVSTIFAVVMAAFRIAPLLESLGRCHSRDVRRCRDGRSDNSIHRSIEERCWSPDVLPLRRHSHVLVLRCVLSDHELAGLAPTGCDRHTHLSRRRACKGNRRWDHTGRHMVGQHRVSDRYLRRIDVDRYRTDASKDDTVTSNTLTTRVVPPLRRRWRGRYLVERNVVSMKSFWPVLVSGFFEPIFYLFAIGIGIGELVGDVEVAGTAVAYTAFAAPAMLAASAMNGAVFESVNIFFKLKFGKIYEGVLATPVEPSEVASGEIVWTLARGGMYSAAFLLVMAVMGLVESPIGILAFPATILIGFAFGALATAGVTWMRTWQDLDLVTLITLPLFLFSATFYPLDVYPQWLQTVTWISPLFHGVVLVRGLTLGILDWTMLVNVAYLVTLGVLGSWVTSRRIGALLRP